MRSRVTFGFETTLSGRGHLKLLDVFRSFERSAANLRDYAAQADMRKELGI